MINSWPTCYAALQWPTHFMKSMQWSVHVHFLPLAFIWPSCNFLTPTAPQNIYMAGVAIRGTFATLKILKKNAYILVVTAFIFINICTNLQKILFIVKHVSKSENSDQQTLVGHGCWSRSSLHQKCRTSLFSRHRPFVTTKTASILKKIVMSSLK